MAETFWNMFGFVNNSKYRAEIIYDLEIGMLTPSVIAKKHGWSLSIASRALIELEKKGVVIVLNSEMRQGRIYDLTPIGRKILRQLKEFDKLAEKLRREKVGEIK